MTFGNTREALQEKSILHDGDRLISERAFNLILGGTLLWGFLLNWITVTMFENAIMNMVTHNGPVLIYIGYFVCALVGSFMVANDSPLVSFIGYNLIAVPLGIMLTVALNGYSAVVVHDAVLYTGIITAAFMAAGMLWPGFFLSMGRVVITGLGMLILGEFIIGIFTGNWASLDYFAACLFGMFIAVDWARCSVCQPTANNAIDSAANLYLDIINLFLRVLRILNNSRRD